MGIIFVWCLFTLFVIALMCFLACNMALNKYKNCYDCLPAPLKALLSTYPKNFLIENKVLQNYSENKIKNANSRIDFYKKLKIYCDVRIKNEIEEISK